jgi:hypothetical protein
MPTSLSPSCRYGGAAPTWAASPPQLVASVSIGQLRVKRYFRLRGRRGKSGTRPPTIARIYWATIQLQRGLHGRNEPEMHAEGRRRAELWRPD